MSHHRRYFKEMLCLTSEIVHEVAHLHLSLRADALVVEISVEEYRRKRQEEDRVDASKLFRLVRITLAVSAGESLHGRKMNE